jgi:hypothetical protein
MPTATATKTGSKVETKVDPEVIVDKRLNSLVENWDKTEEAKDGAWLQIAKYVRDKKITSSQLFKALTEIRGLKDTSARVEVSRFMRFQKSQEASDMLDEALSGGDVNVRDLRSASVMKGEKAEVTDEEAYEKKLISVARYAIEKCGITTIEEFQADAKIAYRSAAKKVKASHQSTADDGETTVSDEDDGEQD